MNSRQARTHCPIFFSCCKNNTDQDNLSWKGSFVITIQYTLHRREEFMAGA